MNRTKRYSRYQQAYIISYSFLKKSILILLLLTVNNALWSQSDSLTFVQYEFTNGNISSEGYLRDGQPDGYWKSFYPDGTLKTEGNRENFQLDGPWKFYNESGELTSIIRYSEGQKNGIRERLKDSVVVSREPYVNNVLEGTAEYFYDNGQIQKIVPYVNGREEGRGYHYNTDTIVDALLTYRSGVLTIEQNVNRYDRFGLKTGLWVEFHRNMNIKVEGTYKDDLKHGFWKYYQPNGNLIRIEKWIMGVLQENDTQTQKIEIRRELDPNTGALASIGAYQDGEKEGVHRQFDSDGNVTGGQLYHEGILLAEGVYDELGRKQGIWKYYYEDGTLKATGRYINDRREDEWKYFFANGDLEQVGRYISDEPDGTWTWYFEDGELRKQQEFFEGLADGPYIEYNDSNKVIITGQYTDGQEDGEWVYHTHNVIEKGTFVLGERQGMWTQVWEDINQTRHEGNWVANRREGIHIWYYKNGQIQRRGSYSGGEKHGIWELFASNGARVNTVEYENGVEVKFNGTSLRDERRRR